MTGGHSWAEANRFAGTAAKQIRVGHQFEKPPRRLAWTIPTTLLARADEVIE
jgi:hypothetical protein